MADEKGEDHAYEVGSKLGFEGPVVPVDFITAATFGATEATSIRPFENGRVHSYYNYYWL